LKNWAKEQDYEDVISYKRFAIYHLRKFFLLIKNNQIKNALLDEDLLRLLMKDILYVEDEAIKVSYNNFYKNKLPPPPSKK
jgi:hypothetical protein